MPNMQCNQCREWKEKSAFSPWKKLTRGFGYTCKACNTANQARLRRERQDKGLCAQCGGKNDRPSRTLCFSCTEKNKEKEKRFNEKLKLEVFNAYGGASCACCGESRIEFLTIDHVDSNGAQHRRELGNLGGGGFYKWLRANNYPVGYQVLCMNCNFAKGRFDSCPHANEYKEDWNTTFGVAV